MGWFCSTILQLKKIWVGFGTVGQSPVNNIKSNIFPMRSPNRAQAILKVPVSNSRRMVIKLPEL